MIDFDTLVSSLRHFGHNVERVIEVPDNAGEAEFVVDGKLLSLADVRQLLVEDEAKA